MSHPTDPDVVHFIFNPWWGCTRVSTGCDHCFAEAIDRRAGGDHWGKGAPRRTLSDRHWSQPLKWNAAAKAAGVRPRVLCATMCDVFDAEAPEGQLMRLWEQIRRTPALDWMLLTKRPARIARSLPPDWGQGYRNAWLGVSAEDEETAEQRLPLLVKAPACMRFVVCEPLLGHVDLEPWLDQLDWIIAGGETGPKARAMHPDWIRSLRDQCQRAEVPFFFKQWGEFLPADHATPYIRRNRRDVSAQHPGFEHGPAVYWVGRGNAGLRLDGRTWEQVPRPSYREGRAPSAVLGVS